MGFDYSQQIDEMDASVFSGEILETHLPEFKEHVHRWQRAIEEQEK